MNLSSEEDSSHGPLGCVPEVDSSGPSSVCQETVPGTRKHHRRKRRHSPAHSSHQPKRPVSPVPSCVSLKSDQSANIRPNLREVPPLAGESSHQLKRPVSPVPSCVSLKSDQSANIRPDLREVPPLAGESVQRNPVEATLRETEAGSPSAEGCASEKHKLALKMRFQHLNEGIAKEESPTPLNKIYTDLYNTEGGRGWVNVEHEVRQIERASRTEVPKGRPVKRSDVFKPLSIRPKPIRTVLTKGVAGIGKTVFVQKFILDWAEGSANQDVHFIFPLPFRGLNLVKDKKLSLVELIQHFTQMESKVLSNKCKIIFIFDGLDESRLPLDFKTSPECCDVTEPVSVDVLLTNLIKGNLLPSALLWITTRPAAANQIPPEYVDQVTEIRGFNDPQKEEYFRKKISDENLYSRTISHLQSTRSLYIMCHIPVFSWLSATVLEKMLHDRKKGEIPRTLTQMYILFLMIQTRVKKEKYTERKFTDEQMILKLGKLAFQQLEDANLIFYEEDLRDCGIDVTEASVYSGVCTQIFREEPGLFHEKVFSFVHLSIQEFLAALYVFLCFSNRERNVPDQQQTSQLSALFRASTLHDLHKTAVDLALQSKNGHLDLFLRFLLGLSLESNQNHLIRLLPQTRQELPQTRSQSQNSEQTVQYVKEKIREDPPALKGSMGSDTGRLMNLFHCLNELNHHAVVELINRGSGTLSVNMLLPGQWETRRFQFEMSEEQLDEFDLQKYIKTPEKDLTELLSPDEVLQKLLPVVRSSKSAKLSGCSLTHRSCEALATALSSHPSSLTELDLSYNDLQDAGVEHICRWLNMPHCKLEKLVLLRCNLTQKSCAALALLTTSSLKHLDLSDNQLLDVAVQHLSPWLSSALCRLEKLQLWSCSLTHESCEALATALSLHPSSLTELDLSYNDLQDAGVEHICRWLNMPHCKLEKLALWECYITHIGCDALASAVGSGASRLRELDLSENSLQERELRPLLVLLRDPACSLDKLEWQQP